jgi:hypothetical protein
VELFEHNIFNTRSLGVSIEIFIFQKFTPDRPFPVTDAKLSNHGRRTATVPTSSAGMIAPTLYATGGDEGADDCDEEAVGALGIANYE